VIQTDLSRWDYKHQVLASSGVPPWRVLLWMKLIEAVSQLRPKSLRRLLRHPDPGFRAAMRWYYAIGRKVWPYELWHWLFKDNRTARGPKLAEFFRIRQGALPARSRAEAAIRKVPSAPIPEVVCC
jgi:anaerobic magnesium-protoporphyrin IX monomethyl ester cyclase